MAEQPDPSALCNLPSAVCRLRFSAVWLCLVYSRIVLANQFRAAMPDLASDGPFDVEDAVAQVSAFSLAGIRAMRR